MTRKLGTEKAASGAICRSAASRRRLSHACRWAAVVFLVVGSAPAQAAAEDITGEVRLPLSAARDLLTRNATPTPPTRDAAIYRSDLTVTANQEVEATLVLDVETSTPGQVLALAPSSVPLLSASLDGQPAPLLLSEGQIATVVGKPGRHQVLLHWREPLDDDGTALLPLNARPLTTLAVAGDSPTLEVRLDGADRSLRLLPGTRRAIGAATSVEVFVELGTTAPRPTTLTAEHVVELSPSASMITTRISRTGQAPDVAIPLIMPPGSERIRATAGSVEERDGHWHLTLTKDAEGDQTWSEVHYVVPHPAFEGTVELDAPVLALAKDRDVAGTILVQAREDLEWKLVDPGGLETTNDRTDRFRYEGSVGSARLSLRSVRHAESVTTAVDGLHAETVVTRGGRAVTQVTYQIVPGADRDAATITLPDGARLWTVTYAGVPVRAEEAADGSLVVPLHRSAEAARDKPESIKIGVSYEERVDALHGVYGVVDLGLPKIDVVATDVRWSIWSPASHLYEVSSDTFVATSAEGADNVAASAFPFSVPRRGRRTDVRRLMVPDGEAATVGLDAFGRTLVLLADWLGLLALFVAMLSLCAHLLLVVRKGRVSRAPAWFPVGVAALAVFGATQLVAPVALPAWWLWLLLGTFAATAYGTVVFWTVILSLARRLGEALGRFAKARDFGRVFRPKVKPALDEAES